MHGRGAPQDVASAVRLFDQACSNKYFRGCVNLGDLYRLGWGVEKDSKRALSFYRNALSHTQDPEDAGKISALIDKLTTAVGKAK